MELECYITEIERERCKRVIGVFTELYEEMDLLVLDAGRFGFVKLQFFSVETGFDCCIRFLDSRELFEELWKDWLGDQLKDFTRDKLTVEMDLSEIINYLPVERRNIYEEKRKCFVYCKRH